MSNPGSEILETASFSSTASRVFPYTSFVLYRFLRAFIQQNRTQSRRLYLLNRCSYPSHSTWVNGSCPQSEIASGKFPCNAKNSSLKKSMEPKGNLTNKRQFIFFQGHPTSKLAKNPLRDISRLLVMFKDCLKICFDQLEKFDLFGFPS